MKKILLFFVVCFAVYFVPVIAFANGSSPLDTVKETIDKIIIAVEKNPSDNETALRRSNIRKIIEPVFNFKEMAQRSLGNNWLNATTAEQTEYVTLFSDLLATTYLKKIDQIKKDTVIFRGHREKGDQALVKTDINYNDDLFPIVYKMKKEESGWKVYDVSIENISLVVNYRNEFAGIIRKDKMSGLIEQLRKKVNK